MDGIDSVAEMELDRIYKDPDTASALDLFERFAKKSLSESGFKEFLDSLPADAVSERTKIEQIISNPDARVDADLSTRGGQLAWAAALGYVFQNNKPGMDRSSAVWKTLTHNPDLQNSFGTAARYLDLSLTNRNATMDWGTPGSWFWFSPDKNHINIDLFHTLLLGFGKAPAPGMQGIAHATGVMLHEVGHSQLTTRWTDRMKALQEQEEKLLAEGRKRTDSEKPKLTRDEYKQLTRFRTEFQLRLNVMNATEDNCVNRYAVNQSRGFPHDFSESMNICNVVLQGTGYYLNTHQDKEDEKDGLADKLKELLTDPNQKELRKAYEALNHLNKALALAFYSSNGLFETKDIETWKRLGIDPDTVKGTDGSTFDDLMKLNLSPEGIANLQPAARDRWLLRSIFARSVETYADRRCKIIDDIWDKYAAPYAKALIDAAEENAEKRMDQKAQEKDSGKDQTAGDQQEGDGKGESSPSQQGGDDAAPSQGGGDPSGGEDQSGGGDDNSIEVEGVGKMDAGDGTPSSPQESQKKGRQGQDEEDINPDDAKTVRDLAHDAKQQEKKNGPSQDKDGKDQQPQDTPPADRSMDSGSSGGREKGVDLASLSGGNWSEFRKRINELESVISRVADDFTYIRDKQKQLVRGLSRQREQLPHGGDVRKYLDMRAHINLSAKRGTGQKIEQIDLQRWKKDQVETEATSVELWILIDGSDSMKESLPGGGRRIDSAVQGGAILYESGKRANFDTFVGMWGDDKIRLLATPGDSDQKVGENFERVRNGINSGTQLSPAFTQAVHRSAKQDTDMHGKPKRFAGMTHFLIISDGELNGGDIGPLTQAITKLFRYGPDVSVDIAVLGDNTGTEMDQVVTAVKQAKPDAVIGIINASSAKQIPVLLAQKIKRRFEQSAKEVKAIPDTQKREAFSRAYKAMKG